MARARYQVLVIPYCITDGRCGSVCSEERIWISGSSSRAAERTKTRLSSSPHGGKPLKRQGIPVTCSYSPLDTCCSIPADCFRDAEALWGQDCFVVPEYAFAVKVENTSLQLSREHTEYEWQRMRAPMQCCNTTATGPPCGN